MNTDALVEVLLRWGHVISGITWIGHLYFFNFVNGPFQGKMDGDTRKKVNPELMPRALWWFRWAAMATLIFGLLLFWWLYLRKGEGIDYNSNLLKGKNPVTGENLGITGRALYIMIGMTLGIIMWFNVWFVIWPAQRQIIGGLKSGNPAPPELGKRALLFSRTNAYLSGPMLALMILAPHGQVDFDLTFFLVTTVVGLASIFLAIKAGPKVGLTV